MLTLIDSTVSATIRHSDNEPIASEAATALVNRDEATGAAWPSKPARDDRIMPGKILKSRTNHPRNFFTAIAGNIAAAHTGKWQNNGSGRKPQASAAILAESATSRSGLQSMAP